MTESSSPTKNRRRTVLYVDTGVGLAGGQLSLLEILKFIDRSRYRAVVCSPDKSELRAECEALGVTWVPIPFASSHISAGPSGSTGWTRDLALSLVGIRHLAGVIRSNGADIVHGNTFKAGLIGGLAAILTGTPLVFNDRTHHGHQPLGLLIALISSRIIAISRSVGAKHELLFRKKLRIVPSGVDTERFNPASPPSVAARICYLGRISKEKCLERLVDCAPAVLAHNPEARFVIAGSAFTAEDKCYEDSLLQRIASLGVSDRFEFPGYIRETKGLLASCSILVLPAAREGLGRVILEAMASERAVVAFDSGGPREIIANGETGILVEPGNVEGLAAAIVSLLADDDLRLRVGKQARQAVIAGFSSRDVAVRIMEIYDEITGE